jgi:hypothetical protein
MTLITECRFQLYLNNLPNPLEFSFHFFSEQFLSDIINKNPRHATLSFANRFLRLNIM